MNRNVDSPALDSKGLRITWVTRSFLDYRIPVYAALDELSGGQLRVIFAADYVPERVRQKIESVLGDRAIGLRGEWRVGQEDRLSMANKNVSLRFHPGILKQIDISVPDVMVADGFFKWTFGALLHKLKRGVPLVVCYERTFHTERNVQWIRTAYRRMIVRFIDAMCCNGRLCSDYTQSLGMPATRITLGHMAADVSGVSGSVSGGIREKMREELEIKGACFLYVGRIVALKGIRELLNGWRLFRQRCGREATLVLVGDGELRAHMQRLTEEWGVLDVRFVGEVDYDHLGPYYAAADVFVIATLEDNWSLVVPEAMACGLPILCSKYNGCWPELVRPGENGWVFDPLDSEGACNGLQTCLEHAPHFSKMGAVSKSLVSNHTPARAAQAIWDACTIALRRVGRESIKACTCDQATVSEVTT